MDKLKFILVVCLLFVIITFCSDKVIDKASNVISMNTTSANQIDDNHRMVVDDYIQLPAANNAHLYSVKYRDDTGFSTPFIILVTNNGVSIQRVYGK